MARTAMIVKNDRRKATVAKYAEKRKALKAIANNPELPWEERDEAARKLRKMPRDASATRVTLRCGVSGRSKGNYRKFQLSRIALRELAHQGLLPGVTKSSW